MSLLTYEPCSRETVPRLIDKPLYEKFVKVKADVAAILRTFFLAPSQRFDWRLLIRK
jgi:hypothetical protein